MAHPSPEPRPLLEVPGRPDLFVGQGCTLDPTQYPEDDGERYVVAAIRATRTFVGGYAIGVVRDDDRGADPRELSIRHLRTDGSIRRELPDWRAVDVGGRARVPHGRYRSKP